MLVSALLIAALVSATPTGVAASRNTDEQVEGLRAQARAVISAAHAEAHFKDDTRWDLPAVRHTDSGMRCLFQPGDSGNRIVFIGSVGNGGGMGCVSRPSGFSQKLEAVRLGPGETLDTVFSGSVLNITFQRSDARAYDGPRTEVRIEPRAGSPAPPEARSARYLLSKDGQAVFSSVAVALVDGWVVRQYFEAPADRAEEADMLAGVVMSTTLIDLASRAG